MRVRIVPALRSKHFETLVHSALSTGDALRRHFDIVHYHAIGSSVLSWVPRLIGMRTIVTVHALDWQRPKWNAVARSCLRLAEWCSVQLPDMTTAVSAAVAEHLHNAHGSEVHIIRNGVTARPTIEASQALPGQLVARRYVLFAGRLSAEKRCDDLIEAFQRLNLQDMTLAIAGGESYDPGHVARLRSLAGPSVQFLGWVDQADLASLYRHCALFVLPSSMEGLPVALLEAMAHGAPALVSNIQPNQEALGQAGRYFEMGKVSSLEEEMGRLLGNPELRRSLGEQGKQRAALQFGWEAAVDSYERLYLRLMGRNRR
jgi:glycosyltransferase involved in cell wall biosynthesis